jgi:GNAT superfamily N-acetyltransferase
MAAKAFCALSIEDDPNPADIRFLEDGLTAFNAETTGTTDGRLLAIIARDERASAKAGAVGWTWAGTCHLRYLYVAPELRRTGIGSRLMETFEREALGRGCRQVVLETYDFQAPEFYRRRGFQVVATVPDHPHGHRWIVMRKRLERSPEIK